MHAHLPVSPPNGHSKTQYYYASAQRACPECNRRVGNCGTQVNITYGYDAGTNGAGHRTSMGDASGSTTWAYDARGRMASETKTIDGHTFTTQWTYFSNDAVASMTYPDGEVVNYAYHPQGALSGVWGTDSYASSIRYDAAGRIIGMNVGDTLETAYTYFAWDLLNGVGRLKSITAGTHAAPTSILNLKYSTSLDDEPISQYDAVGNIERIENVNLSQI